ncbi:class I SAM-dependent methyltransferase [Halobacillus seohaensis]|uniref:Class I SAM-dependent methyltransferase n=1 Tax=Halobacillus seohaensis TaxID=447421 RepID=A0ABW2EKZ7_9BACI
MSDSIKRVVQENFSKSKEAYVTSSTHSNQSDLDTLTDWLRPQSSWTILDIATGGGHVAKQLSPYVNNVFANDLTKDMLGNTAKHMQNLQNLHYVVADAEDLPFLEQSFDAVTCRIAPHHFPNPKQFVNEVHRVLKTGSYFLMIDNVAPQDEGLDHFYNSFEKMRDTSHSRALKISEWKNLLHESHFSLRRELTRKKTLPFDDWANRTLDSKGVTKVENYFKQSSEEQSKYFHIKLEAEQVLEFSIDEWMVLCTK